MTESTVEPAPEKKVPALVVSGFLGSGKTTLIRRLLDEAVRDGVRVALVSNELGELGIDRALLGEGEEAYVEIEGGCVCCELSDDLLDTLEMLWQQVRPDRVVVETSGVALPFDTQLNFWRDPVRRWIGEDMAVVVVNAEQLAEGRDLEGTFTDQVTSADLLVLNKIDLVSESERALAEQRLRAIEPEAPLVTCTRGDVPGALLFPPDPDDVDRSGEAPSAQPHHHEAFETEEWRPEAGLTAAALERALAQPNLLRAKGFVETDEGVRLVQVVGRRIELSEPDVAPSPDMIGRVVLIRRADADNDH
jgi:cobalamin biosynthesis protein CobW